MAEPPVTITTSSEGATAACHLCPWTAHTRHSLWFGKATERISACWAEHFATAHSGSTHAGGET